MGVLLILVIIVLVIVAGMGAVANLPKWEEEWHQQYRTLLVEEYDKSVQVTLAKIRRAGTEQALQKGLADLDYVVGKARGDKCPGGWLDGQREAARRHALAWCRKAARDRRAKGELWRAVEALQFAQTLCEEGDEEHVRLEEQIAAVHRNDGKVFD